MSFDPDEIQTIRKRVRMRRKPEELSRDVLRLGQDIINSERFKEAGKRKHHKRFSVASHSFETAEYSLRISRWMNRHGINSDETDAVRASLMHDLGMTEDPVFESPSYRKAFLHPRESARIAEEEFEANEAQRDAIRRHMWPIGIKPPHHNTGWIVNAADKYCSIKEVLRAAGNFARPDHIRTK